MDNQDWQPESGAFPEGGWISSFGAQPSPDSLLSRGELLPNHITVGNRFASCGLFCAIVGLLSSLVSLLQLIGWASAGAGAILAGIGFVRYCHGKASNRDEAVIGGFLAWLALAILLTRASVGLQIPMVPY
jgi:hypothetical protein